MNREIVFWSIGDYERLMHESIEEAIEDMLGCFALPDGKWSDNLPETVEVKGYARMQPSLQEGCSLDHLMEWLDDEYGDPDRIGGTMPTEAMLVAERAFHAIVLAEYESFMCEDIEKQTVNVREWIEKHPR